MDRMPTDVPPLPALIALYLVNCRVEGKSPADLKGLWLDAGALSSRALQEDGAPQDVGALGPAHVIAYLERSAHLARETRHRYFREVRCFFAWGQRTGFLQDTCGVSKTRSALSESLPSRSLPAEASACGSTGGSFSAASGSSVGDDAI